MSILFMVLMKNKEIDGLYVRYFYFLYFFPNKARFLCCVIY